MSARLFSRGNKRMDTLLIVTGAILAWILVAIFGRSLSYSLLYGIIILPLAIAPTWIMEEKKRKEIARGTAVAQVGFMVLILILWLVR